MNRLFARLGSAALAFAMVLAGSRLAQADTITIHDLSFNTSTGVYTYTIQLDAAANVQSNDGFAIYDFLGLTSWSIAGGLTSSQFALTQTGSSNTLNNTAAVDSAAGVAAITNSVPAFDLTVNNLSFSYVGPPTTFTGATTAVLTLDTVFQGSSFTSVYASVDHSGVDPQHPFGDAEGPVTVPGIGSSAPLPHSFWSGSLLFALLAGFRIYKSRSAVV
jgi:hypothetical protein